LRNSKKQKTVDWTEELFSQNAKLYLPMLESMKSQGIEETAWLIGKFQEYGITTGSRILDLYCGIGRHAIPLAKKGYTVVGYDPSEYFIKYARTWANSDLSSNTKIRFYVGPAGKAYSVLSKCGEYPFDAIIMMFNCLGYSSDSNDKTILSDAHRIASSNCLLVVQTENRDWRLKNFQPAIHYEFESILMSEDWSFDFETSVSSGITKFYDKKNPYKLKLLLELTVRLRLYSLHELIYLIDSSGWRYLRSYGGFNGKESADISDETIFTLSSKSK
jgi:SAM-dependent methyltransferase